MSAVMPADTRPRRGIVASAECATALGGVAALARAWGAEAGVVALEDAGSATLRAGEEYLVVHDLRLDGQIASDLQKRMLAAGASMLFVGLEPGTVQIGPLVRPGVAGCLDCLANRVRSNHPNGKSYAADMQRARPSPQRPLSPAAVRCILSRIAALGASAPGGEHSPLPVGIHDRVRVDSLETVRHRFIPVTHCAACAQPRSTDEPQPLRFSPRIKRDAADKRPPNPKLSLAAARRTFVGRYSGLIKHVFQNRQSDLMPLFTSERAFPGGRAIDYNHGRASNYRTSELIAILEGIERYAGNEPRGSAAPLRGSYARMRAAHGDRAIDPARFILHTEEQYASPLFELERYSEDLECGWVWGHSVRRGVPVLVPEQFAFFNLKNRPGALANRFVYDSSNGCSLGGSLEEAALGGLHEVVERDAYFSTWYSRIPPARIDIASVDDPRSAALIARSVASGFEVHLFDMTGDTRIPVVGAMIVDPADDARVKSYCASACDGRWGEAIFSALAEVTTSMGVYRKSEDLAFDRARAMYRDHDLVRDMYDHVLLYCLPETFERLGFLLQGEICTLQQCRARIPDTIHVDLTQELRSDCDKVLHVAEDVIIVDQTFPELAELGLSAAKVIVPGFLPVTFGHQYRRVDMGRLERFARARGRMDARFAATDINPYPHNFP